MSIIKVYLGESEEVYSSLSQYAELYMEIKKTLKKQTPKSFYTNNLKMFRWLGFIEKIYPEQIEFKKLNNSIPDKVIPKFPLDPNFDSIKEWKNWILTEYFSYKKYFDEENKNDKKLDLMIDKFSNFYYQNYNNIKNSNNFISRIIHDIDKEIKKDEISVLLVIDNLNFYYEKMLSDFLKERSIYPNNIDYYFTTIPSETKYGKQALLECSAFNLKSNWDVSKLRFLKNKFKNKNIIYINKISDLKGKKYFLKDNILVVNYLELDKELHYDDKKTMVGRKQKIEQEFKEITRMIKDKLSIKNKLSFYIVTDHGSIKRYGKYSKVDNKIINSISKSKQYKVLEISDLDLKKYSNLLSEYGYIVEKNKYQIDKNFVIAKEDVFFKDMDGEMYFHGGLSPDEICVPFLHLKNY